MTMTGGDGERIFARQISSPVFRRLSHLGGGNMKRVGSIERRENRQFFLYISPWLLGFLIFTLYPMVHSFIMVFTDADLTGSGTFIGVENLVRAFAKDDLFYKALVNTL